MAEPSVKAEQLQRFGIFSTLSDDELAALAQVAKRRRVASGEWLFRAGDPGTSAFFVEKGRIAGLLRGEDRLEVLDTFDPGDVFGELCLVEPSDRGADARATEDSVLLELDEAGFAALRGSCPTAAVKIVREITRITCARIGSVNARIEAYLGGALRTVPGDVEAVTEAGRSASAEPRSVLRGLLSRIWG
jgi:CRP-like cAMP-binding protein